MIARIGIAARAGVHLVQVRERELDGGPLLQLVERCIAAARGTRARVIVNERLDVALAAGAHGVHLRGDSMPARRVRSITPAGVLIGRSVHGVDEARRAAADGADYLLFGTVFESASKPGRSPAGVAALAQVAAATTVPVLAVGGITVASCDQIAESGAAGVAAIGMFLDAPAAALGAVVERLAGAFETCGSRSRK